MNRHNGIQSSRNLNLILFVLVVVLAGMVAPAFAVTPPAAIDQYTEQMPAGPGGPVGSGGGPRGSIDGTANNGGSAQNGQASADGGGGFFGVDVPGITSGGEPSAGGDASARAGNDEPPKDSSEDAASVGERTSLPLVGSPSTPWVTLLLAIAAAGLLSAALVAYARRRRAKHTHG